MLIWGGGRAGYWIRRITKIIEVKARKLTITKLLFLPFVLIFPISSTKSNSAWSFIIVLTAH